MNKITSKIILTLLIISAFFLRFLYLNQVPVALFSDELDIGYQAYSLIKTGRDYSGNRWPLHFESQAENRAPLYIYASVPSVYLFGITPLGVRLPAIVFGVLGIWAIYLLTSELMLYFKFSDKIKIPIENNRLSAKNKTPALLAALLLTISPWHLQYSRAGFEITLFLFLITLGFYFLLKAVNNHGKYLWIGTLLLCLAPWTYSTAKLFIPLILFSYAVIWYKEIRRFPSLSLLKSLAVIFLTGLPMVYLIIKGDAGFRFNYISVFTDPTIETQIGYNLLEDAQFRNKYGGSVLGKVLSRVVHNKISFVVNKIGTNLFKSISTEFLFLTGDPNLRHSTENFGQFYKIDIIFLITGLISLLLLNINRIKFFILCWFVIGLVPSIITRDGGVHASRLSILLPVYIISIVFGIITAVTSKKTIQTVSGIFIVIVYVISFIFYLHNYYMHYPWYSERSWHFGYKQIVDKLDNFKGRKIIITNTLDNPKIFFASYSYLDPNVWQNGFETEYLEGFGNLEKVGSIYFGQKMSEVDMNDLYLFIGDDIIYVASEKEIGKNLIMDPQFTPRNIILLDFITYPSGEPAFYFLGGAEIEQDNTFAKTYP